jgi:hypothetical protein
MNTARKARLISKIKDHLVLSPQDDNQTRVLCCNRLGESLIRQLHDKNTKLLPIFQQPLSADDTEFMFGMPLGETTTFVQALIASIPDEDLETIQQADPAMFAGGQKVSLN